MGRRVAGDNRIVVIGSLPGYGNCLRIS
jgi:hypothetical protein